MYFWDDLARGDRPVVLYGMGNGGDKIFEICERRSIPIRAVFSSDDHPNRTLFHGLPVETLAEVTARWPAPVILLAFGTERPEVIAQIAALAERYEVLAPDLPLCGGAEFTPDYRASHAAELDAARRLLADEQSRRVFDALLENKETGRLEPLLAVETPPVEKRSLIPLGSQECFLDLGAFTGDTVDEFLDWTGGSYAQISAMEPNPHNYQRLVEHTRPLRRMTCLPYASWDKDTKLTFRGESGRKCGIVTDTAGRQEEQYPVQAIPVDSLRGKYTFVKLDVEGAEAETLLGMRDTLNRCHPALQLSVYHKTEDFYTLPLLLEGLCPGYRMYLRHHPALPAWELQLYCRWEEPT